MPIDPSGLSDDLLCKLLPQMRDDLWAVAAEMNRRFGTPMPKHFPVGEDDVIAVVNRLGTATIPDVRSELPGSKYRDVHRQLTNAARRGKIGARGTTFFSLSQPDT